MTALVSCLVGLAVSANAELQRFQGSETHMGTTFEIVLFAPDEELAERALTAGFARIGELDRMMSDYKPESELNRLSRSAPTSTSIRVSRELFAVLKHSRSLSVRTKGAFDVTVGPLSKLWRRARRRKEFPSPDRLSEARDSVGYQFMKVHQDDSSVELFRPGMRLDLGAIAKGFAGDEALQTMESVGITAALINAGGDIVAGDAPPGQRGWRVGVARLELDAEPSRFLWIANSAVATSGDAWQYVEIEGERYSHILDPRTGLGLITRSSVTVVARRGIVADSLASAVSVLGSENGLQLIEELRDVEALIVHIDDGMPRIAESDGFRGVSD